MSKINKVGEWIINSLFKYENITYRIKKFPSRNMVVGINVNPISGKPLSVKIPIRDMKK